MSSHWSHLLDTRARQLAVGAGVGAALLAVYGLVSASRTKVTAARATPSPVTTLLPHLSPQQRAALPYPPDIFPGARDVDTPYGVFRAYEFGPEAGRRLLFVHGDATPAPVFEPIAKALAARGCRVLLIDLWGKGYSEAPLNVRFDARLYHLQIDYATGSSAVDWTTYTAVGFSLGTSILASYLAASAHPEVTDLILLGPAGFLEKWPAGYDSWAIQYAHWLPAWYRRRRVGQLLGADLAGVKPVPQHPEVLARGPNKTFDVPGAVQLEFDQHAGFARSLLATIREAKIFPLHAEYAEIYKGIAAQTTELRRVLMVFGTEDTVTPRAQAEAALAGIGGTEYTVLKSVPGGHGFAFAEGDTVADMIVEHLGLYK